MTLREQLKKEVSDIEQRLDNLPDDRESEVREQLNEEIYPALEETADEQGYLEGLQRYVSEQAEKREDRDVPICTCTLKTAERCSWKHGKICSKFVMIDEDTMQEVAERYQREHPGTVNVLNEYNNRNDVSISGVKETLQSIREEIKQAMENKEVVGE